MPKPLNAELSFVVQRVRRNNGVIETFFTLPGGLPDEFVSTNLMKDRGEPKVGERYVITFKPEFPHER